MILAACEHAWKKNGFDKNGNPSKRCKICGTSYVDRQFTAQGEMRTDLDAAAQAVTLLCEGMAGNPRRLPNHRLGQGHDSPPCSSPRSRRCRTIRATDSRFVG